MTLSEEQQAKLVEIVKCYIRTWENELETAKQQRWSNVADTSRTHIEEATEILEILEL